MIATKDVTILAGFAGSSGFTDGAGSTAKFDKPYGITTDGTNLYVVDTGNHTIRKIVIATGEVATLAGAVGSSASIDGTGSAANFAIPLGITTDGTNLYVNDLHAIRKIVIATKEVTTLAGCVGCQAHVDGTGSSVRFNAPISLTTDGSHLYVADYGDDTIREIGRAKDYTVASMIASISGENGKILRLATAHYAPNATFTISYAIKPDTNYNVRDVLVDGKSVNAVTSYSFNNVAYDSTIHTVVAYFILKGDVNNDRVVDIGDAVTVLQYLSNKLPAPSVYDEADINNDHGIGMAEAIYALQMASALRTAPSSLTVTDADNGKSYAISQGTVLTVELPSYSDGGYRWALPATNTCTLEQIDYTHDLSECPTDTLGCSGKEVWTFKAQKTGTTQLKLLNYRSWEGEEESVKTFILNLLVL